MAQAALLSEKKTIPQKIVGYKRIEERLTPELIFAFVEPIGGGADSAITALKMFLKQEKFKYKINEISVSSIIEEESRGENIKSLHPELEKIQGLSEAAKRINKLQQLGNVLRKKYSCDFLARKVIQQISKYRLSNDGIVKIDDNTQRAEPLRVAHIIKSIKNEKELELLKAVYGRMLFLIAVSGNINDHIENYKRRSTTTAKNALEEFNILTSIDQDEGPEHGQQVRGIFYKADIFLNNNPTKIQEKLEIFLELLFGQTVTSPSLDEKMMFEAFASSLRSCCLSRQVGAAIACSEGELISTGWNDVPAPGGGLSTDDNHITKKSLCKAKRKCHSNESITTLLQNIITTLQAEEVIGEIPQKALERKTPEILKKSGLSSLIEFSRAIHAEMEAILAAARAGRGGLLGATLFVTTYPCENCVKHILAVGIKRVVYIEPYPKSKAKDFFSESLVDDSSDENKENKLIFSQFTGISPGAYMQLFKQNFERKNKRTGAYTPRGDQSLPLTNVFLDGFTIYESRVIEELSGE